MRPARSWCSTPPASPLTVSSSGDERRNVIVWMDHRAIAEARQVNETQDDVLRYVGGSISPEMEIPKLLWLKRHLPSTYRSAGHFFDLADYLSFRATGSTARSMCTLACKWNYLAHEQRWSGSYFERIGLGDLAADNYAKIGNEIVAPGTPLGAGLTKSAARDFGLLEGTPVGASLIDAHAGGVGTIGGRGKSGEPVDVCRRLAYIMGTSACIMATTPSLASSRASGVPIIREWFPDSGSTRAVSPPPVRPSITSSGPIPPITRPSRRRVLPAWKFWNFSSGASSRASPSLGEAALLARDIHVLPEFLGNRSPFADPDSRAVVAGMDLDVDIGSMERLFVAGLCGLAYGLADVVEAFRSHGVDSDYDGDQRRRGTKSAGPPDHGGYDRPDRCGPRNPGTGPARRCHAGRRRGEVLRIDRRGDGLDVGDRPAERTDATGIDRLPPDQAAGSRTDAKAGSRKPRCDAERSHRSPDLRRRTRAMLLSCGDALVDFLPVKSVDGRDAAVPVVGGSCLNIAVGMARLGAPAGFVGGISTDLFGRMIADHALGFAGRPSLRDAQ